MLLVVFYWMIATMKYSTHPIQTICKNNVLKPDPKYQYQYNYIGICTHIHTYMGKFLWVSFYGELLPFY